jgi:hypothetical protein
MTVRLAVAAKAAASLEVRDALSDLMDEGVNRNNTGGTLSANDGSHNANLALLGQFMASSFVMASDGHDGTLITDPPLGQAQVLSQSHR